MLQALFQINNFHVSAIAHYPQVKSDGFTPWLQSHWRFKERREPGAPSRGRLAAVIANGFEVVTFCFVSFVALWCKCALQLDQINMKALSKSILGELFQFLDE
jgi:hypothetical protein